MPPRRTTKSWFEPSLLIVFQAIAILALCCAGPAWSAGFLTPLPIQDLTTGERYALGIRPSRSVARRTLSSKIDLYAEGLSSGASFRMVGDEIWELVWLPAAADSGVHNVRILVTERGRPTEVLEMQDLTFVVNGVPVTSSVIPTSASKPSVQTPSAASSSAESIELNRESQPSSAFVAVDMDAQGADTILVVPANTESTVPLTESDGDTWSEFIEELDESNQQQNNPSWSLASIPSRVVTPHQWVRFPVELVSDSGKVGDFVAVQVDALPNGATFDENSDGTRQFQWRPGTADGGEHVFNFTAVDTTNSKTRQTVTMRIIVQE